MQSGVLAGYNVVDVKVTLYDGSYHEVDSSEMAFKIAGSMAFKEAMKKADPVLLEPIMKVVVIVPDEYMGDVIGDLNSRRGMILGMDAVPGAQQINSDGSAVRDVRLCDATCVQAPRAAASTPWSPPIMQRFRSRLLRPLSQLAEKRANNCRLPLIFCKLQLLELTYHELLSKKEEVSNGKGKV